MLTLRVDLWNRMSLSDQLTYGYNVKRRERKLVFTMESLEAVPVRQAEMEHGATLLIIISCDIVEISCSWEAC